ncbi:MAG: hypothetical protein ACKVQJ_14860 [Pyrinomonadaceae bacterium]
MELHQIKKPILPNGTIVIDELPFEAEAGDIVNITLVKAPKIDPDNPYPLRGTPYRYDDPFGPLVDDDDWKPFK